MADKEKKLEHTDKNAPLTTKDATDQGVPMAAGEGPQGPEDALEKDTRGDYTGRLGEGESYSMEVVGHREDGSPIIKPVKQK